MGNDLGNGDVSLTEYVVLEILEINVGDCLQNLLF
jgi:hypothetical protein